MKYVNFILNQDVLGLSFWFLVVQDKHEFIDLANWLVVNDETKRSKKHKHRNVYFV